MIPGIGVHHHHDPLRRETTLVITDEEMASNDLVRAWAEAIIRAEDAATTELRIRWKETRP
jgi:hypothetical protein